MSDFFWYCIRPALYKICELGHKYFSKQRVTGSYLVSYGLNIWESLNALAVGLSSNWKL
jgi:hypothetical protein